MGWLIMAGATLVVGGALGWFLRREKGALQFLSAALLLALAGYSWQGHPGYAGSPKAPPGEQQGEQDGPHRPASCQAAMMSGMSASVIAPICWWRMMPRPSMTKVSGTPAEPRSSCTRRSTSAPIARNGSP